MYNENFINIKLGHETIYVYSVRRLLQNALDKNLQLLYGTLVDLGCGEMPYRDYILDKNKKITKYIGVDVDYNKYHQSVKPDMYWDGAHVDLVDGFANSVLATELFEHIPNLTTVLTEIYRILAKDGILYFTVPFIWPLHETPYDEYRYTPYSLTRELHAAGFKEIEISPLGGYNASLAQMLCIWIYNKRNSFKPGFKRVLFKIFERNFLYPLIKMLIKKDDQLKDFVYGENTMAIGFYCYAKK